MSTLNEFHIGSKDQVFESVNVPHQCELLDSLVVQRDSCDEFKFDEFKFLSCSAVKEEECPNVAPLSDPLLYIPLRATVQASARFGRQNVWTCLEMGKRQGVTFQKSGEPNDLLMLKKLLQLTLPKKHVCSRWTKLTTESILTFLKSFVTFAQNFGLTHSSDRSLALRGPRILKCEECFLEFSGLYDRYLKLFTHYKTDHSLKCNMLIGQKWIKCKKSLGIMVEAWKLDLKYELQNSTSRTVQLQGCVEDSKWFT